MESLVIDKQELLDKLNNVISELITIKNDLTKDKILEELTTVENVKESDLYKESPKTLEPPRKKSKLRPIKVDDPNDDINRGYRDFYDPSSRPDIHI